MNALASTPPVAAREMPSNVIRWDRHATTRIVLDTGVIVAAACSAAGASRILLRTALRGRYRPLASTALLLEYEGALLRAEQLGFAVLSPRDALVLLDAYAASAQYVRIGFSLDSADDEPNDTALEAAANADATALVTLDRTIPRALGFGINILSPRDAVRKLRLGR